jgi:hypothetical protein
MLASKCAALWRKNFEERGFSPENFNPETGERSGAALTVEGVSHPMSCDHQSWSMLLPFLGVKELIDMEIWTAPDALRFGSLSPTVSSVENYPWHGHFWKVVSGGGSLALHRDGQLIFQAVGGGGAAGVYAAGGKDTGQRPKESGPAGALITAVCRPECEAGVRAISDLASRDGSGRGNSGEG